MGTIKNLFKKSHVVQLTPKEQHARKIIVDVSHAVVLILSLLLIVYMSYDTFMNIAFLENKRYMTFQFWVCVVFLADFFIEWSFSENPRTYLKNRWFFFIISIPYLNIIDLTSITFSTHVLYYIRFIPLIRGGYSMAMVIGYFSHSRAVSLLYQYASILVTLVYLLALLFYYEEHAVNSNVINFWDALYWAAMNCTTVGCYFSAVTPVGEIISVILPTAGMLMLPLFTVFVTDRVKQYNATPLPNSPGTPIQDQTINISEPTTNPKPSPSTTEENSNTSSNSN